MYYKCLKCSYLWKSRGKKETQLKCPKCNSKRTEHVHHHDTGLLNPTFDNDDNI